MSIRITLLTATALAVALGWYQLSRFATTPGEQLAAPARLPGDALVSGMLAAAEGNGRTPLLLIFIHPRCSCTQATLEELDQVLENSRAHVQIELIVYRSKAIDATVDVSDGVFEGAKLLHRLVQVFPDRNGALAQRFGAATSGEIVLYGADGRLLFQGGITSMRSQAGDSAGAEALRAALTSGAAQTKAASVFGCPIFLLERAR